MSNLERTPPLTGCGGLTDVAPHPVEQVHEGREVDFGAGAKVKRLLPNLARRLVGAWCFVDHYGPEDVQAGPGMHAPPHPHTGLQTVSWLLEGDVHHRDSIGSDQTVHAGHLGLMTAGRGIAHAEHSGTAVSRLHGIQLWVALPDRSRNAAAAWDYHDDLPRLTDSGLTATLIMGAFAGAESPGRVYSPLVGLDIALDAGTDALIPLEPEFEHAALLMVGAATVEHTALASGAMLYLGCGRRQLRMRSGGPARLILLGGAPFEEKIVMWWNFVGRSGEEIADFRRQWQSGTRFGSVRDAGTPLTAPPLPPGRLVPGGALRTPRHPRTS